MLALLTAYAGFSLSKQPGTTRPDDHTDTNRRELNDVISPPPPSSALALLVTTGTCAQAARAAIVEHVHDDTNSPCAVALRAVGITPTSGGGWTPPNFDGNNDYPPGCVVGVGAAHGSWGGGFNQYISSTMECSSINQCVCGAILPPSYPPGPPLSPLPPLSPPRPTPPPTTCPPWCEAGMRFDTECQGCMRMPPPPPPPLLLPSCPYQCRTGDRRWDWDSAYENCVVCWRYLSEDDCLAALCSSQGGDCCLPPSAPPDSPPAPSAPPPDLPP